MMTWQVMDQFEQSFEDMDVRSEYIEGATSPEQMLTNFPYALDECLTVCAHQLRLLYV